MRTEKEILNKIAEQRKDIKGLEAEIRRRTKEAGYVTEYAQGLAKYIHGHQQIVEALEWVLRRRDCL